MHHWIDQALQYAHQHPHMGELFAFLVALAESLPIIGTIVPGSITMTAIGALVGAGVLPWFLTLFFASLGSFIGDMVGFILGVLGGDKVHRYWPFSKYPKWLTYSETFFKKHGGKSVLIGRFFGPARSTVPLVAGLLKMRWPRFIIAAIPSAVLWATAYMLPGVLLGAVSSELPKEKMTEVLLVGFVVILLITGTIWAIQRFFTELFGFFNQKIDDLWDWLNRHYASHSLISFITDRENPSNHHQLTRLLISLFFFTGFGIIYLNIIFHSRLLNINQPLFYLAQSLRSPWLTHIFVTLTLLGEPKGLIIASLLIGFFLAIFRQWRTAYYLIASAIITALLVTIFKHAYFSARPTGFLLVYTDSSCPSGHTTLSLVFYGFLAYLSSKKMPKPLVFLPTTLATLLITGIALSRLYLGAHWMTDILASVFLGAGILLATILIYWRMPKGNQFLRLKPSAWFVFIVLGIVLSCLTLTLANYKKTTRNTAPIIAEQTVSLKQWWHAPTQYLPIYRHSRLGRPAQPFNIQWAGGDLASIQALLEQQGWIKPEKQSDLTKTVQHFTSSDPAHHQPLLPLLYNDQKPALFMLKSFTKNNSVMELRLWPSTLHFNNSPLILWIGTLNIHSQLPPKDRPRKKIIPVKTLVNYQDKSALVNLQKIPHIRYKVILATQDSKTLEKLKWSGQILIIKAH